MSMTYSSTGVSYELMDPFKLAAQHAALETSGNITRLLGGTFRELAMSRGESVFLIETPTSYLAHVVEGLGTKCRVADAMYRHTGKSYYGQVAQCTVAMIVNDMVTLGALPLSVAMHIAVGSSDWFKDEQRSKDLIDGWKRACDVTGCVWGGGETPTLQGIVVPGTVVLSGSAVGIIEPKSRLIKGVPHPGDRMVFVKSSGIHANGLTLARSIAERKDGLRRSIANMLAPEHFPLEALPRGYMTLLSDGTTYGETLLEPTLIYVPLVEACLDAGVDIHYTINVTGHGWRKLMRAQKSLTYVAERIPKPMPIFEFIQKHGPVDGREAYGNLNMGLGFVLFVTEADLGRVLEIACALGFDAFEGGYVEAGDDEGKSVKILPLDLEFSGETLAVR